jgi:hypothetical protein
MRIVLFIAMFLFAPSALAAAGGATLYVSESCGSYTVGDTFPVSIMVYTGGAPINAAEGVLNFTADSLEVEAISKDSSVFVLWTEEPSYSNRDGEIRFSGGVPNPGYTGSVGTILDIVFRVKDSGIAALDFSDARVLANDGKGTDILSGTGGASYTCVQKPAERAVLEEAERAGKMPGEGIIPFLVGIASIAAILAVSVAVYRWTNRKFPNPKL